MTISVEFFCRIFGGKTFENKAKWHDKEVIEDILG